MPDSPDVADVLFGAPFDPTAVSTDGSTVFFTSPLTGTQELWVWVNGKATEISVSAASATTGQPAPDGARFLVASPDGSTVLFYSLDQLTDSAPSGGGIYSYQVASGMLSFLTPLTSGKVRTPGGLLAASPDLSYLYLCENDTSIDVFHAGELSPVATTPCTATGGLVSPNVPLQGPDSTPDSGYVFQSTAATSSVIPGSTYDNAGHSEVYLYSTSDGSVTCVSCRPDNAPAQGDSSLQNLNTLDNPSGHTVDPTSCNPMSVTGTLSSTGGLTDNVSSRFQVGGCTNLGFSPKLKIALSGKGKTRSGDHPTLTATLTDPSGQANLRSARVALPLSLALDPNNSQHVCNYQVAQAVTTGPAGCPASTIVGQATADTPLLSQPLTGQVYLVQGIRFGVQGQAIHTLPSLLIPLRGQIALDLRAQSSVSGGKLVTTFSTIPDAPVSKFTLQITGGKKGLLVITGRGKTICGKAQVSDATLGAQSGKSMSSSIKMATPCRPPKKTKKRSAKHGKAK